MTVFLGSCWFGFGFASVIVGVLVSVRIGFTFSSFNKQLHIFTSVVNAVPMTRQTRSLKR